MEEPQCIETRIHRGGGGKVAIIDFGKVGSDYSVNITRAYRIPEGWDDVDVEHFEDLQLDMLKARIDPILDAEFQERWKQKVWENDR